MILRIFEWLFVPYEGFARFKQNDAEIGGVLSLLVTLFGVLCLGTCPMASSNTVFTAVALSVLSSAGRVFVWCKRIQAQKMLMFRAEMISEVFVIAHLISAWSQSHWTVDRNLSLHEVCPVFWVYFNTIFYLTSFQVLVTAVLVVWELVCLSRL